MPSKWARVCNTLSVCGKILSSTKHTLALAFTLSRLRLWKNIIIASAAAVPSSRSEAFTNGNAVISATMV